MGDGGRVTCHIHILACLISVLGIYGMILGAFAFEVDGFRDIRALATYSSGSQPLPGPISRYAPRVQHGVLRKKPRGIYKVIIYIRDEVFQPLRCCNTCATVYNTTEWDS